MSTLLAITIVSVIESIISFSGVALLLFGHDRVRRVLHFVLSFSVGALLGVAFLDLLPEAIELSSPEQALGYALAGTLLFFVLEKFLSWYHCHDDHEGEGERPQAYLYLVLWGDFIHNFIDGISLALAFMVGGRLGVLAFFAIILHEIPQEISDFGVLLNGGMSRARALWYNFLVSLATIGGAFLTYALGDILAPFLPIALGLVAGNFMYLAMVDLLPELHKSTKVSHSLAHIVLILAGIAAVIVPERFLG